MADIFSGSHDLYLRFGFVDMSHTDIDLNEWDNFKFRGFGVYRSYAMLRQPGISGATWKLGYGTRQLLHYQLRVATCTDRGMVYWMSYD